ncbi:MAG TPA: hypothetical protein VF668_17195 [Pyrinomonadaceae bacterium]|jgi:hypothetical protein
MTTRKRIPHGRALLLATLIVAAGACARPGWHPQSAILRAPDPEPITATDLRLFEEMLEAAAAGVGGVGASRGGVASRRVCVLEERHTSVAGQLEAAVMLMRLHERYGLRHIAVEGLTTDRPPPSTDWFRRLGGPEDEELRHELLAGFLREGEISAAELLTLAYPDVVVHAADDPSDYALELTPGADVAPAHYLYKIGLKSIRPEHYPRLRQFTRRHRVAEMVEYVISLDGWARVRREAMKRGGVEAPVEQTLRELDEIEARAGSVNAEITADERAAMSEARAFFEAAARRSAAMVEVVRGLDPSARTVVLNLGAAHTESVSRLLGEAGATYAVLSPASLSDGAGRGELSRESFERKGRALSVAWTDRGLGSLLDGRKKPLPVADKTWFKAAAQLRFATVLIARARLGPEFPEPELRRKIDALDHVRVEWGSVRQVGSDKLFTAATLGERGWTNVWGYCGRPRAEIIRRGRRSLEELLVESLNAVRGERGRRTEPARGPVFELVTQDVIAAYARGHEDLKEVLRSG